MTVPCSRLAKWSVDEAGMRTVIPGQAHDRTAPTANSDINDTVKALTTLIRSYLGDLFHCIAS
jgi:hypothetical protein